MYVVRPLMSNVLVVIAGSQSKRQIHAENIYFQQSTFLWQKIKGTDWSNEWICFLNQNTDKASFLLNKNVFETA